MPTGCCFFVQISEDREIDKQLSCKGCDQRYDGDLGINGRTCGILERIADGVSYDSGLMGIRAFSSEVSGFDILLGIVPESAGIVHEDCKQEAGNDVACKISADGIDAAYESDYESGHYGNESCRDELLKGSLGGYVYALVIFRLNPFTAFLEAFDGVELSVNLLDHLLGVPVDAHHEHCGEHCGDSSSYEHSEEYQRIHEIETSELDSRILDYLCESGEERYDGKSCSSDCKALRYCL